LVLVSLKIMQVQKIDTFGGHRDCVYALAPGPTPDTFFSSGADGQVVRWRLDRPDLGTLVARVPASVYALHFDADTGLLWVGQNYEGLHLIDPAANPDGNLNRPRETASLKLTSAAIFDLKAYKKTVFAALSDGVVAVIDADTLSVRKHLKASDQSARCVAINPVERELAVGYSDHQVRIFDLESLTLKQQLTAHTNSVFTMTYSPDFRFLLTAGRDAHLKVWDVEENYALHRDVAAHLFAINHLVYQPAGRLLATASMDKSIKIWDADTFQLLKVVDRARHAGHATSVNKLLWTDFQGQLISGSDDRTLSVWKVDESAR
jgi:WD40 repeat protein